MVRLDDFLYSFKYAFKAVTQTEDTDPDSPGGVVAPDWFLDYVSSKLVTVKHTDDDGNTITTRASKPVSFARVRFWQTSKGFYEWAAAAVESERKEQISWGVVLPARYHADSVPCLLQVVARDVGGRYKSSAVVKLSCPAHRFFDLAAWHLIHGAAVGLAIGSYCVPAFIIKQKTVELWKLQKLEKVNRLSLPAAETLRQMGQALLTC
jgi:hypothetical protein